MQLEIIKKQTRAAAQELLTAANSKAGQILVVGCSTSEVVGAQIGMAGSAETANEILAALSETAAQFGVFLAIQCCEHLNRALVVERAVLRQYSLAEVAVLPVPHAGGALAAQAMRFYAEPIVVESIVAHVGLDIGATLIGMHLKPVAIPVRLQTKAIGQAMLIAARTRPKLIGGSRAVYQA